MERCAFIVGFSMMITLATEVSAFGEDDRWTSGWGQGIAEAVVTKGSGNSIYVTCGDAYGRPGHTAIQFSIGGDSPKGQNLTMTFDDEDPQRIWVPDGRISSDCRACMDTYTYVIEKLKKHSTVHIMAENGDAARFTLKGSSDAIGSCEPDFAAY